MKMRKRVGIAAIFVLVAAGVVWSQLPFGAGGGPFGFRPPGGPPNPTQEVLQLPEGRKELMLRPEQQKTIDEALQKFQTTMGEAFRNLGPPGGEDDDREKRFAEMRAKSEEAGKSLERTVDELLDERQLKRLNELRLQRQGLGALARPEIAKKLRLTEEQQATVRDAQPPAFGPPPPPPGDNREQLQKLLTEEQRAIWTELTGAEFKFPPRAGGPGQPVKKLVSKYDEDHDGRLNAAERKTAGEALKKERGAGGGGLFGMFGGPPGRGPGGPGGPPGRGRIEPGTPGKRVAPTEVESAGDVSLYDPNVIRTLFFTFENPNWEQELEDFHNTDVEVPATLTVDGQTYPDVGLHFRGMSSYGGVPKGSKRSLNVSVDFADSKQRLGGYKTLNLLNCHEDPTFLHTVLYSHIARQYIPAPKANFVRVVINGESWGLYVNVQQFDKIFVAENFAGAKGTRWKVGGSPGGGGGLDYVGDKVEDYKRRYEIKSDDREPAWQALIKLCRTLKETPDDRLEQTLEPLLDIDGTLRFLALDMALINCDGYWIRASDYSLFLDAAGKFHVIPHDMNEAFQPPMGPGMGGPGGRGGPPRPDGPRPEGPGRMAGGGYTLDPLTGLNDARKPLRSRLLAVPALRAKYLDYVRAIARDQLDWQKLGPTVARFQTLIEKDIEADTRKLSSLAEFQRSLAIDGEPADRPATHNLYRFATERRKYLLDFAEKPQP